MKYNEKWLRDWVTPDVEPDALLEQLTMAGLEVDSVTAVAGEFSAVVVGRVAEVAPHPNADKLSVCQVEDGSATVQVVCGAPNVRPGLITAFARVGAVLPGNFRISRAKLRDVVSHGMLCSAAELGLGDDHDGILELPDDLTPGRDLREALDLDDRIIDLDLTPNRGDCLSIRGLAREVGVLTSTPVTEPPMPATAATIDDTFEVQLTDPEGCPRYLGRVIRGVDIRRPSPPWLTERLRRAGLRSIDPIVDVTNLVMMELGQPMHAFDLEALAAPIVVRRAVTDERLTLLDGREVTLDERTLLITDASGPVAIAGVMGGERSGVQSDTRDVFLECAFFSPLAVAGTARRYGLHTDASHRYERGVDYELQHLAMDRATALLLDIVGGEPGPVTEAASPDHLPVPAEVTLREQRLCELLGVKIDPADVDQTFARLGFELLARSTGDDVRWTVRVPSHRFDIEREADLVEEVCRIYGYNNVPSRRPVTDLALSEVPLTRSSTPALKRQLVDLGYQEVITYSFIDPRLQDLLAPGEEALQLENPMSLEQSVMRTSLFPGLVEALKANVARQQDRVRLFEVGQCFLPGDPVQQPARLGAVLWGRRDAESWAMPAAAVDFFDLKGDLERLLAWTGLEPVRFEPLGDPVLHPGQAASVLIGDLRVGRLGRLHPEIEQRLDIPGSIFVMEVDADAVLARARRRHGGVSRFPSVRRDLAIVVKRSVTAAEIVSILEKSLQEVLIDLRLFDVYQGKGIDSTEKSLGVGLTLQKPSATLTEEEIGQFMQAAIEALANEAGARLR